MLLATVQAPDNSFSLLRLNPSGSFQSLWFISEAVVGFCPSCCPPALLCEYIPFCQINHGHFAKWMGGCRGGKASSQSPLPNYTQKGSRMGTVYLTAVPTQPHLGRIKSFSSKPNLLMCCKGKRPLVLQTQRNHMPLPRESLGDEMWYTSN